MAVDPERVVLLDLNSALTTTWADVRKVRPFARYLALEEYRQWLVDLLADEHVVLLTVRREQWRAATLARIAERTGGFEPADAVFRPDDLALDAPAWKAHAVRTIIRPRHPDAELVAIESNRATRAALKREGVTVHAALTDGTEWTALPWRTAG